MAYFLPRFQRKRRRSLSSVAVLEPYVRPGYWQRHRRLGLILLGITAFFYGAFFSITTIYLLQQMAVPLVFLALIVIWLLPERGRASVRTLEQLFFAFLVALMFWPDYLALALPGLPWITALRLVGFPLALVFLIALSQSASFRADLKKVLNAAPLVWQLVTAFSVLAIVSIGFSTNVGLTVSRITVSAINWVMIFFIACYVLAKDGRVERLFYFIWAAAIFMCVIGILEARTGGVLWAGHVPSLLKIDNPLVQKIMAGSSRTFEGSSYRVQAKFVTPLELAEFLVSALPFTIFIMLNGRATVLRIAAFLTIPAMIYVIFRTDARLGNVGMISSFALCTLIYGFKKWRDDKSSLVGLTTIMSFPFAAIAIFVGSFFVGRLRKMVWGTGMQVYSTDARQEQIAMGIPKILSRPWGYGFGNPELGYVTPDGFETIDSYYLSVGLETGPLGFLLFYGIFVSAIWMAVNVLIKSKNLDRDHLLLGAATVCLINFLIIKSVLSQISNHPLFFVVLGALVALLYRIQQNKETVS